MAVKGDLNSFSLIKLVQMICLEKRQIALLLKYWQREGVIYFHGGEMIHAHTGSIVGEAAVHQLLNWPEGTFRISDYVEMPPRTINSPWDAILLGRTASNSDDQSTKTSNNTTKPPVSAQPRSNSLLSKVEMERDSDLENDMIVLVSQLQYLQTQLLSKKSQKRIEAMPSFLAQMVNEVTEVAEKWMSEEKKINTLHKALDTVSQTNPVMKGISETNNRLNAQAIGQLARKLPRDKAERQKAFKQLTQGLQDVMETHFLLLIARFRSSAVADRWRETYEIFLAETQKAVEAAKI